MGILDGPLRKVADDLIGKLGRPVVVTLRDNSGGHNRVAGQQAKTPTTVTTSGVIEPLRGGFAPTVSHEGGTLRAEFKVTVPALPFTTRAPRPFDQVSQGGSSYRIVEVVEIATGELAGMFELRIAR